MSPRRKHHLDVKTAICCPGNGGNLRLSLRRIGQRDAAPLERATCRVVVINWPHAGLNFDTDAGNGREARIKKE